MKTNSLCFKHVPEGLKVEENDEIEEISLKLKKKKTIAKMKDDVITRLFFIAYHVQLSFPSCFIPRTLKRHFPFRFFYPIRAC